MNYEITRNKPKQRTRNSFEFLSCGFVSRRGSFSFLVSQTQRLAVPGLTLVLVLCTLVVAASAQQAGLRPARSLTSEDLLDRRAAYVAPASVAGVAPSSASSGAAVSAFYRDPSGAFVLNFPSRSWQVNAKGAHGNGPDHARSFRKVEEEGFTAATANVYVLEGGSSVLTEVLRLSAEQQQKFAGGLATRFLSSNSSPVSIEQIFSGHGLRVIADQQVARRTVVRAVINVFERHGRLYVVVCSAPFESFDNHWREFNDITASLASSVLRS